MLMALVAVLFIFPLAFAIPPSEEMTSPINSGTVPITRADHSSAKGTMVIESPLQSGEHSAAHLVDGADILDSTGNVNKVEVVKGKQGKNVSRVSVKVFKSVSKYLRGDKKKNLVANVQHQDIHTEMTYKVEGGQSCDDAQTGSYSSEQDVKDLWVAEAETSDSVLHCLSGYAYYYHESVAEVPHVGNVDIKAMLPFLSELSSDADILTCYQKCNDGVDCCGGTNACHNFIGKVHKDGSCKGEYACTNAGSGGGRPLEISGTSCVGTHACNAVGIGGDVGKISGASCDGYAACRHLGRYGKVGDITGDCNGHQACFCVGYCGGIVEDISGGCCIGSQECKRDGEASYASVDICDKNLGL